MKKSRFLLLTLLLNAISGLLNGMDQNTWQYQEEASEERFFALSCANERQKISAKKLKKIKVIFNFAEELDEDESEISLNPFIFGYSDIPGIVQNQKEAQTIFQTFMDLLHKKIAADQLELTHLYHQINIAHKLDCKSVLKPCLQALIDRLPDDYEPAILDSIKEQLPDDIFNYELGKKLLYKYSVLLSPVIESVKEVRKIKSKATSIFKLTKLNNHELLMNYNLNNIVKINTLKGTTKLIYTSPNTISDLLKINDTKIILLTLKHIGIFDIQKKQFDIQVPLPYPNWGRFIYLTNHDLLALSEQNRVNENKIEIFNKYSLKKIETIHANDGDPLENMLTKLSKNDLINDTFLMLCRHVNEKILSTFSSFTNLAIKQRVNIKKPIYSFERLENNLLAFGDDNGRIHLYDNKNEQKIGALIHAKKRVLRRDKKPVQLLVLNKKLLFSRTNTSFRLWDVHSQNCLFKHSERAMGYERINCYSNRNTCKISKNRFFTLHKKKDSYSGILWDYNINRDNLSGNQVKQLLNLQYRHNQQKTPIVLEPEEEQYLAQMGSNSKLLTRAKQIGWVKSPNFFSKNSENDAAPF